MAIYPARPVRTVAPAALPVTVAEIKAQARIDHTAEDSLLAIYAQAATDSLDGYSGGLGLALVTQTWRFGFDGFGDGILRLPLGPVQSVVVAYLDQDGTSQTVAASNYRLAFDHLGAFVSVSQDWALPELAANEPYPVSVTAVCGFGDAASVPGAIRTAILMIAADMYARRESEVNASGGSLIHNPTVERLLGPYRLLGTG